MMETKGMRTFNYSAIKNQKWDSEILGLIAAIYKEAGKQEFYLKQRPDELEKLVEIAKIQSTEASNAIEGIVTTNTRIRQLVEGKNHAKEQKRAGNCRIPRCAFHYPRKLRCNSSVKELYPAAT